MEGEILAGALSILSFGLCDGREEVEEAPPALSGCVIVTPVKHVQSTFPLLK